MKDSICMMKDVLMAFNEFEKSLIQAHSLSLNEAMVLCLLGECEKEPGRLSASAIAEKNRLFCLTHFQSAQIGRIQEMDYTFPVLGGPEKDVL